MLGRLTREYCRKTNNYLFISPKPKMMRKKNVSKHRWRRKVGRILPAKSGMCIWFGGTVTVYRLGIKNEGNR